jgi:hypothetical protein
MESFSWEHGLNIGTMTSFWFREWTGRAFFFALRSSRTQHFV